MTKKVFITSMVLLSLGGRPSIAQQPATSHPETTGAGWVNLFKADISDAIFPKGIWTVSGGVMTASKDETIYSAKSYNNYILDLEFKHTQFG